MAENLIRVVFEADSSALKKAFKEVDAELGGVSGKGVEASNKMAEGIKAVGTKAKESTEHLGIMGKAAEKGQEIVKDFGSELVKFAAGGLGIVAAFEMVKKSVETSMESETMHVRLTTIIGDADKAKEAIERVEKASDEMSTSRAEGLAAMQTLLTAGTPFEKTDYVIKGLEADVKLYSGSLQEVTEIYAKMQLKGDEGILSVREMNKLVQFGGAAAREAATKYAEMDHELEVNNALVERNLVVQQRAWRAADEARAASRLVESQELSDMREVADRRTAAASIMAKATGEDKAAFALFETKLSSGVATYQKPGKDPLSREQALAKQYEGGAKELAATSGYSRDEVNAMIKSSEVTPEMLISENQKAIMRGRSESDKALSRERGVSDKAEAVGRRGISEDVSDQVLEATKQEKIDKRALARKAMDAAIDITPGKEEALERERGTTAGKAEAVKAGTENIFEVAGDSITEFFKRLTFLIGQNKDMVADPDTGIVRSRVAPAGKDDEHVAVLKDIHSVLQNAFGQ